MQKKSRFTVLQEHTAELVLGIIAIITAVLVAYLGTPANSVSLAVAAVGIQIAAALYLLKYQIFSRLSELLDERLELYDAISKIATLDQRSDYLLLGRANQAVEKCRRTLAELMNGRVRDSADSIFHLLSEEIRKASYQIRAVHVGHSVGHIERWSEGHMRSYYKLNAATAKRLKFERIFVLYRDEVIDPQAGKVYLSVLNVLKRQYIDGIKVFVAWDTEVKEKSYIQDWVVVDDRVAEYGIDAGGFVSSDWPDREAFLSFDKRRIQELTSRFERLQSFSSPLEDWLEANRNLVPREFTLVGEVAGGNGGGKDASDLALEDG